MDHVKPMFDLSWTSLLAGFSGPFQYHDEVQITSLCLEGIRHSIRVSCIFDMSLQKHAFVSALYQFTQLGGPVSTMRPKNMAAINCLINVGCLEGNYLNKLMEGCPAMRVSVG